MNKPLARAHAALQALARPQARDGVKARIEASANEATVYIYDEIGGFGVQASDLVPELADLDVDSITVKINSPGGDYFDGVAIANALASHRAPVTIHVDGLAASAASVIAMAGDEVVMHPGSRMMIHDALTMTVGNAGDHATAAQLLDGVSADIAELYASRAGSATADGWRELMRAESWYTADAAVAAGLAHRAVSRETSRTYYPPAAASAEPSFAELIACWRGLDPQNLPSTVDADAPPAAAPQAAVLPLSELLCSAYRKDVG